MGEREEFDKRGKIRDDKHQKLDATILKFPNGTPANPEEVASGLELPEAPEIPEEQIARLRDLLSDSSRNRNDYRGISDYDVPDAEDERQAE